MGGAYGWLFPISSTLANVGIGIDLAVYKKKRLNINKEFKKYFSQIQQESKLVLIENSCAGFTLPYGNEMPALYSGNKVIIGDAASMINPLTGEGIFYAMQAGKMLACHVASCTGSAPRLTKALADFSDSYKKSFEEHFRLNLMLKKILASPFAGFAFKKIASQEQVLDKAMNIIMGNGSHLSSSNFKIRLLKKMTGVK
jgi:flavin-dependent dehydrogenase